MSIYTVPRFLTLDDSNTEFVSPNFKYLFLSVVTGSVTIVNTFGESQTITEGGSLNLAFDGGSVYHSLTLSVVPASGSIVDVTYAQG